MDAFARETIIGTYRGLRLLATADSAAVGNYDTPYIMKAQRLMDTIEKNRLTVSDNTQLADEKPMELLDAPPSQRVAVASEIARQLADVVQKQHLSVGISGREHVLVEGWVTLGFLCGLSPREVSLEETPEGDVLAKVEIIRLADGAVIGGASALVGADEGMWQNRPRFARRSMAVTRATGKAFRLALGWVMRLAGYEATPAEEMQGLEQQTVEPAKPKRKRAKKAEPTADKTPEQLVATIESTIADAGDVQRCNVILDALEKYKSGGLPEGEFGRLMGLLEAKYESFGHPPF